jgi:ferredoxin
VDAIHLVDGRAGIGDGCKGCGRCVEACPQGAIELSVDVERSVRASIKRLAPLVDLS